MPTGHPIWMQPSPAWWSWSEPLPLLAAALVVLVSAVGLEHPAARVNRAMADNPVSFRNSCIYGRVLANVLS